MPLQLLQFNAGVVKDITEYTAGKNGPFWVDSNLIRFQDGLPAKVGGWAKEQIDDRHITHVLVSFDIDTKDGKKQSPRGISMIKVDRKQKNIKIFLLCNAQIHRMRTKNTVTRPSGKNLMIAIIELANFMSFRTITLDALDGVVSYYAYVYDFVPAK